MKSRLSVRKTGQGFVFSVGERKGEYKGMPAKRTFEVEFHLERRPESASVGGKGVDGVWNEREKTFTVSMGEVGANGASLVLK